MIHHQTEQIRQVYAKDGNHLLADLDCVLAAAAAFPEFRQAPEWLAEVLEKYPNLMFSETFSDGMNRELIFSYHGMYIHLFTKFYQKLEELGYAERLADGFKERLAKMHEIYPKMGLKIVFEHFLGPKGLIFGQKITFPATSGHRMQF